MFAIVIVAAAALIALALWWQYAGKRQQPRAAKVRDLRRPSNNYHCVEVRYRRDACDAVKQIAEKRFLPGEAPELPAPGCDATKCTCRYVHHDDRRQDDRDRRSSVAHMVPASAGGDRRKKRDRRKTSRTSVQPKKKR